MKIYLLLICLLAETSFAMKFKNQNTIRQNAIQVDSTKTLDSLSLSTKRNNNNIIQSPNYIIMDSGRINIIVKPAEANNASIILIQNSRTKVHSFGGLESQPIDLDTVGIWKAPLSIQMSFGDYNMVLHKEGFEDLVKKYRFIKNNDSISLEMISFEYLQHKREQYRSYKWISAGIFIVAGITSYYFYNRVKTYQNEYNEAVTSDVIHDKRDQIDRNRRYYKISSGITLAALGGFVVFWSIELSF
jgi:hypothetical protein